MTLVRKISLTLFFAVFLSALTGCGTEAPEPAVAVKEIPASTAKALQGSVATAAVRVSIATNKGDIEVALNDEKAPVSVANFLAYVDSGHFEGTIFHRVIPGFMIQGGGYTETYEKKSTLDPIVNEATNGLANLKYSLAMARTGVVDSATAQFFINVVDNDFLNYKDDNNYGYAVFGQVVNGFEVVDAIAALKTGAGGIFRSDVPAEPVIIQSISRL